MIDSSLIVSCSYTQQVNISTNLTVGDATASVVNLEIRNPSNAVEIGEALTYIQIENGFETQIGIFYVEMVTKESSVTTGIVAYDGIAKLAVDFSEWLNYRQQEFPLTLRQLVSYACTESGLTFSSKSFPNEGIEIPAFYAQGVTARQVVTWAAQLAGRFVRCDKNGVITFDWYTEERKLIAASFEESDELKADTLLQYSLDSLTVSDYVTKKIDRVQFKQSNDDVGVIYPDYLSGNVFSISENNLAALLETNVLRAVAKTLYDTLKDISYTPLSCTVKRTGEIRAGDIVTVRDASGNEYLAYVMSTHFDSSGVSITSTGDESYSDKAAVSSSQYQNIPGKMLTLRMDVDGLKVSNSDMEGRVATLELTTETIQTEVSNNGEEITTLRQTAEGLGLEIQSVIDNGVSKVATGFGLTVDGSCVDIHRDGTQMHNSLDETGMYVRRGDEVMLQANSDGVIATDVTVRNYLVIGNYARFEDYSDGSDRKRTACFWMGGD